jgi:hypothetical protein
MVKIDVKVKYDKYLRMEGVITLLMSSCQKIFDFFEAELLHWIGVKADANET